MVLLNTYEVKLEVFVRLEAGSEYEARASALDLIEFAAQDLDETYSIAVYPKDTDQVTNYR